MSKVIILPDIHGRTFWKYALEHIDEFDKVIFLGDYLDPYPHEGITFDESVENFKEILEFKKNNIDKVELLIGNHDCHYIWLDFMDCSRLNRSRRKEMNKLYNDNYELFRIAYLLNDKYLFSHAGVYKEWLVANSIELNDFLDKPISFWNGTYNTFLEDLSYYRGGNNLAGSIVWADIRESLTQPLLDGYYQIVGHTQMEEFPYLTNSIACLDVRRPFVLDLDKEIITNINGIEYKIYD